MFIFVLDIDECTKTINPCINGTCNNTPGSFDCFCEEGYSLTNRTFCSKVNTTIMSSEPNKALFLYIPLSMYTIDTHSKLLKKFNDTNFDMIVLFPKIIKVCQYVCTGKTIT